MSKRIQEVLAQAGHQLRHEPLERRVRAKLGAETVLDSTRAMLVWEPRRVVPSYAVPAEDIDADLSPAPATNGAVAGVLHPGIAFGIHSAAGEPVSVADRGGAGFRLADEDLAGYVELDFDAFDAWLEEDELIEGHPRSPFHCVEIHRSSRPVRIELDGELLAETTRARLLSEATLPLRFYIPREDIRAELEPSPRRTYCPYKGHASYWSLALGGNRYEDLAWIYRNPLHDAEAVAGHVAFWDERVDVYVDGEPRGRPESVFSAALRDEFGV